MDNQELEINKQKLLEEEKPRATLVEKLKEQRRQKRKKIIKRTIQITLLLFFSYVMWFLLKPYKASREYGICRTVLELNVPYPHTLHVSELKHKRGDVNSMILWYTHVDAFGVFRMEPFTCKVERNSSKKMFELTEAKLNKVSIEPERLAVMNNAMIYFEENPLVLNYPLPLEDNLRDLKVNSNAFRRYRIDNIRKNR